MPSQEKMDPVYRLGTISPKPAYGKSERGWIPTILTVICSIFNAGLEIPVNCNCIDVCVLHRFRFSELIIAKPDV